MLKLMHGEKEILTFQNRSRIIGANTGAVAIA